MDEPNRKFDLVIGFCEECPDHIRLPASKYCCRRMNEIFCIVPRDVNRCNFPDWCPLDKVVK